MIDHFLNEPSVRKSFIVSGGRTATTLFGNQLGRLFPHVYSIHEPDRVDIGPEKTLASLRQVLSQGFFRMGFLKALGFAGTRNLSLRRLSGAVGPQKVHAQLIADRSHIDLQAHSIYVESNYQLFGVIRDCLALPNAYAAFLLRHPSSWIESWLKKKWYGPEDRLSRIDFAGFKRITPANVGIDEPSWDEFGRVDKLAWVWGFLAELFETVSAEVPSRTGIFRFEDLTSPEPSAVAEQQRFLQLVLGDGSSDTLSSYRKIIQIRDNESPDTRIAVVLPDWFRQRHSAVLVKYGYEP